MFSPLNTSPSRGKIRALSGSLAAHGILLAWLLHAPSPKVLVPSSVAFGENASSVTHLYWPAQSLADGVSSADNSARVQRRAARRRLTWQRRHAAKVTARVTPPALPAADEASAAPSSANPASPAGTPYGSLADGPASGDELRPALPVATTDPVVPPADLPVTAGNEVVEITIDASGTIVQKVVLQSLGPAIDSRVLAALENWHFTPATRNGVAIPSKQDVYYHFRARA
jgi:TonB family protein